jgi:hypothetical protein
MRHARAEDLDRLEPLLDELRTVPGLREKGSGTFYRGSRAFLHFHADGEDLYADVRVAEDFERMRVTSRREQAALFSRVRAALRAPD